MEKRKRKIGDRYDGRRVRTLPPMNYISPFVMKARNDAYVLFENRIELGQIEEYIRGKRRKGMRSFGFMHVIISAYVRVLSQRPALNRFISGQRIFQREEIVLSMMIKKSMSLNDQETGIKTIFQPEDTIYDVYRKLDNSIQFAKEEGDSTDLDNVARVLVHLPALVLRFFVGVMGILDYFGIMPKALNRTSPFHASIFFSNLGSLGIPPVFHHLYNFGNIPAFMTFGSKYTENVLNKDGVAERKKYINYTVVLDERITDGHYMANALKYMEHLLKNPHELDTPPETVVRDLD
ncbi:MAG: 2-oxo acid dehydrogenase subunit E2 [Oscillospiraceae bacterium]|nr:2-oxo acid dehydrogenase subunit E2 [Oscillospiraceae bacterium]